MSADTRPMLRVLHSLSYAENGGAQVVVANLVREEATNSITSYVSFWKTKRVIPGCMSKIERKRIIYFRGPSLLRIIKAIIFVRRNKIDVLHSHTNKERREMSIVSIITKCPHVVHVHTHMEIEGQFKPRTCGIRNYIHMYLFKNGVSRIIATSSFVEQGIKKYCLDKEMVRIEPGIDFTHFLRRPQIQSQNQLKISVPQGMILIGCPSRMEDKKGIELLIEVVSRIDNIYVILAGVGSRRQDYFDEVIRLGIKDRVHFVDYYNDMTAFYSACDIVVVPSEEESFGLVFLESIATHSHVVASDIPQFMFAQQYSHFFCAGDADSLELVLLETIKEVENNGPETTSNLYELEAAYSMQSAAKRVRHEYDLIYNIISDNSYMVN